jgi:hypothetical protein
MNLYCEEPLDDAELDEIERYTIEALGYRHQPEFVHECARLIAEIRRLRGMKMPANRSTLERLKEIFASRPLQPAVVNGRSNGRSAESA